MQANNRLWVLCTFIVVAAVVAMGWLIGVSPKLDEASANKDELSMVEMQNTVHQANLARIKKEYEQLDSLKAQLASLRQQLPASDDLSTFIGELHALEQKSKVTITSITTGDGQPYVAAVGTAAKGASTGATNTGAAAAGGTGAGASAAGAKTDGSSDDKTSDGKNDAKADDPGKGLVTQDNFVAIPIGLTLDGTRAQVMNFIDELQNGKRLFLVAGLTVTESKGSAGADAPAGDETAYNGSITGFVYVLLDNAVASAPADAAKPGEPVQAAP